MIDLLNPDVARRGAELQRAFLEAGPFGYIAVDDFLDRGFCEQLIKEFPAFEEHRARNEMGQVGRKELQQTNVGGNGIHHALPKGLVTPSGTSVPLQ